MKGKQQDFRTEKYIRYGIRKYSFGAASVAIAAGLMFLGNGAVSATEVQAAETPVAATTPAEKTDQGTAEVKPETTKAEETKPEVKAQEAKKVNKAILEASIATLERNIKSAPDADQAVLSVAREALEKAKAVLSNDATTQEEVDAQVKIVNDLDVVVTEAQAAGVTAKVEEKKAEEKAKSEAKQTLEVKEAKKELTQVASEAEVTNKLAETELAKADVKEENKAAVTAAVAKNQAVLAETKTLLADTSVTKEQVDAQLERLNESILAVYNELKKAGIGRDGKFSYVLAEEANYPTAEAPAVADQTNHYKKFQDPTTGNNKHLADLNKQLFFLDWADKNAEITGLGKTKRLTNGKVGYELLPGSTWKKEITPGYIVTVKVKELKNLDGSENGSILKPGSAKYNAALKAGFTEEQLKTQRYNNSVFAWQENFNGYSAVYAYGLKAPGNTTISGDIQTMGDTSTGGNAMNLGITFEISATYNGRPVKPNFFATSAEEAGPVEAEIYRTNGKGWELLTEVMNNRVTSSYTVQDINAQGMGKLRDAIEAPFRSVGYSTAELRGGNPELTAIVNKRIEEARNKIVTTQTVSALGSGNALQADGLGTQQFGPVSNARYSKSTPIMITRGATEISAYLYSAGFQAFSFGVVATDEGDAPSSYGDAVHLISEGRDKNVKHPFIGSVKADLDEKDLNTTKPDWTRDETNDSMDEGPRQLMGDAVKNNDNYTLHYANKGTYELEFQADPNGNPESFVKGWIDFNNNGKFDEGEASDMVTVTSKGKYKLTFTNIPQNVDTTVTRLGMRIRTAISAGDIENPTGFAYSGEVEDFRIQQVIPPRGTKEETKNVQGVTQNATVAFNAYGQKDYDFDTNNVINTSVKSQIVKADGSLVKDTELVDGYYVVQGQGKYKITDNGKDVNVEFVPDPNFVGTADGITIRRTDANGNTTGWGNEGRQIVGGEGENKDQLNLISDQVQLDGLTVKGSMDGRYIPTVTPKEITAEPKTSKDVQGKAQKETPVFKTDAGTDNEKVITPSATTPAKLIDPVTKVPTEAKTVTVDREGTYTINPETGEVTFQPLPTFTGKAKGIGVSLTAPVGVDKTGARVTSTATTTYTPEVTPVKPTAEPATSTGLQGETQTGKPTFTAGDAEVPIKTGSVKLLTADGTEAQGAVPALDPNGHKVGEYTVDPATGIVTFTPTDKTYVGPVVPAKVQAEDKNGTKVETKYTPSIVGVKPTATPAESSNIQGEAQSGTVTFAPGKATIEGVEKSVAIKPNSAVLLDKQGNPVMAGTPVDAEDANGNKVGEYTINPATNTVTFTPTDKTYTGKVLPANVQAEDENGTTVKTTYTPHIVGVKPTADPATSTDVQGAVQSKEVTFEPGKTNVNGTEKSVAIDPASFKLLDENGQPAPSVPAKNPAGEEIGTYTLNVVDGKPTVVLTPTNKAYSGAVKSVTIQAADTNGTTVTTTYTPTITPIKPTGTPLSTEGIQGAEQSGTPTFTQGSDKVPMKIDADQPAKLVDPATGNPTNETTIPAKDETGKQVGTYTIKPTTGEVTFTPNKDFKGTPVPATVEAKDANGTPATAKYTPTVKPATPTGTDAVTEDVQGATQEGTPVFTTGKATVNGTEVEVPFDTKVPAKLVDPATKQPTDEKSVKVPNEGTYTIDETGKVTFTPEKTFTGKTAGIDVRRVDTNGTPVTAKYTPVVKPATPTSSDVVTTNVQGATQEGTPTFTGGKVTINGQEKTVKIDEAVKPKFDDETTTKTVPNEGTYTIDETGKVTFTPEKTFTGQATGVTVKRVDTNGTPVTAKYTPVVIPVSPTSKDAESEGPKGQSQEGTPTFTGGKVTLNGKEVPVEIDEAVKPKFDDGTTTKKVPNEGTYTIDENGKVTFTPEPNFVGKAAGVTVKRVDTNGTPVTAKYIPTVRPDTRYVVIEKDGKETDLLPSKDGAKPSESIPGYNVVRTEIDEKGNTKHIYEKVKTSFKDKEGNEIPKYPSEPGTVDKKDIPEYRFVETKKLPNGDTEHIYERVVAPTPTPTPTPTPFEYKVITTFVDENGVLIIPDENGSHPGKPLENYELVRTETDANGNVRNVYRKIQSQKPVQPVEPATPAMPEQPAKPEVPATPVQPTAVKEAEGKRELPNTGTEDNASLAALGLLGVLSGFGLVARKKKED